MASHINEIKKSVSFIFVRSSNGSLVANGTGFFVGVKTGVNTYKVYFVTAKHVLQDKAGNYLSEFFLRINKKNGESEIIKLTSKDMKIYEHQDKDVDIAIFNCLPDENIFDFKFIQDDLIANKELVKKHEIEEGDDIFFSGLFTSHIGQKKNQPIIRFGKVALISDEKIEWKEDGKDPKFMDLYLLECQSFGGNSGSPVFFQLNPLRKPGTISMGGANIFLAGIMTGSFLNWSKVQITQPAPNLVSLQNIGIAAITPAYKLYEMLFYKELIEERSK